MSKRIWMPLYVGDYLRDTQHLTGAEHGAYLLLIMHYWTTGGLPKEDHRLAAIARMSTSDWALSRNTIAAFFALDWTHKRIDAELAKMIEVSTSNQKKARLAAVARWASDAPSMLQASNGAETMLQASPEQCSSMHTSQPQSHKKEAPDDLRSSPPREVKRGTRLSGEWKPSEQGWALAGTLLGPRRESVFQNFQDHWLNKPGKDALKLDWNRAWMKWVRTDQEWAKTRINGRPGSPAADRKEKRYAERDAAIQDLERYIDGLGKPSQAGSPGGPPAVTLFSSS